MAQKGFDVKKIGAEILIGNLKRILWHRTLKSSYYTFYNVRNLVYEFKSLSLLYNAKYTYILLQMHIGHIARYRTMVRKIVGMFLTQ